MSKCWVYHKTEDPKIIDDSERQEYLDDGWARTPAAFLDLSSHIDMTNDIDVQMVGGAMEELTDRANDALAAETARSKGLKSLAEKYEVEVGEMTTKDLRIAVIEAINGDSA